MSNTPGALIALSGGVDSTVAAYLMKQAGCRCMGATMRLYQNEDLGQSCLLYTSHEAGNNAVEGQAVVKAVLDELLKVLAGDGRCV